MKRILLMLGMLALLTTGQAFADTVNSAAYLDNNSDGRVETVTVTFDENITCSGAGANGFSVTTAGTINIASIDTVLCNGSAVVTLTVTADANKTGGATAPVFAYSDASGDLFFAGPTQVGNKSGITPSDAALPRLTTVTIASSDSGSSSIAYNGDVITLAFTGSEKLVSTPTVDINSLIGADLASCGGVTDTSSGARTGWSKVCTVQPADGRGLVSFTIDFVDDAANAGTRVTTTTNASSVTISERPSGGGGGGSGGGSGGGAGGEEVSGEDTEVSGEDTEVSGEDEVVSSEDEEVSNQDEVEGNTADEEEELMEDDDGDMDDDMSDGEEEEEDEEMDDDMMMVELESETFEGFHAYLAARGIVTSADDCEEARCSDEIARKELAAIAVRLGGHPMVSMANYGYFYTDIDYDDESDWVAGIVETAAHAGIISSSNTMFHPDMGASRAETYAMLMSSVCVDIPNVSDDWKTDVFLTASALGFTVRSESEFGGDEMVLRQDVFAMATRILQYADSIGGCE